MMGGGILGRLRPWIPLSATGAGDRVPGHLLAPVCQDPALAPVWRGGRRAVRRPQRPQDSHGQVDLRAAAACGPVIARTLAACGSRQGRPRGPRGGPAASRRTARRSWTIVSTTPTVSPR
jgi:hypothetical protein